MKGYQDNVLRIDLNNERWNSESLNKEWARDYLGGKGLGIKYIYEELKPNTAPLSANNKLILMTGPFTGTIIPCSGKLALITRSPATGTVLDCSIGGHIASELKYAGYDGLILEGKAPKPSYLYIEDEDIHLLEAGELWGKGSHDVHEFLAGKYGKNARIMSIGPAGENLLPMACINSEYYRQAGRGGIGAVMGSKNLKAIVVKGSQGVKTANVQKILERANEIMQSDTLSNDNLWTYTDGTPMIVDLAQTAGILPTHNFQDGTFSGYESINAAAIKEARIGKKACTSCALGCGNFTGRGDNVVEGPEYETLALCASNCGIDDLEAVIAFNDKCDDFGLDSISAGNVTALAMEITEKGIHDFGLKFKDKQAYLEVPEKIAKQEGIGKELAMGSKALGERYGVEEIAMEVKGLEIPGYEPRGSWSMGLAYATADRGACHLRAWPVEDEAFGDMDPFTIEGKAQLVIELQHYNAAKFSTILCDFWALTPETTAEMLSLVTGESYTAEDMDQTGERIVNTARLFNLREGFSRKDDTLPGRVFNQVLKSGVPSGKKLPQEEFEKMLLEYYSLRGWDEEGRPGQDKLIELGLESKR